MSRHPALPISLYLRDRTALVAGEGPGPERRAHELARAGAHVLRQDTAAIDPETLSAAFLVIAQTGDAAADAALADAARAAGALGYAHDQPAHSDFAMPAVARRGPLAFAISTDGIAPGLAGHIRRQLDTLLAKAGTDLDALLTSVSDARARGESRSLLARIASRLQVRGGFEVDPPPDD